MAINLVYFNKKGRQKNVPLREGVTVLGRRPDCDVRIPLGFVSRKHCRIIHRPEKTMVQDLSSANGTFVNSRRVIESVVKAGDQISVGSVIFTLQIDGHPAQIEPPSEIPFNESGVAAAGSGQEETVNLKKDALAGKKAKGLDEGK